MHAPTPAPPDATRRKSQLSAALFVLPQRGPNLQEDTCAEFHRGWPRTGRYSRRRPQPRCARKEPWRSLLPGRIGRGLAFHAGGPDDASNFFGARKKKSYVLRSASRERHSWKTRKTSSPARSLVGMRGFAGAAANAKDCGHAEG